MGGGRIARPRLSIAVDCGANKIVTVVVDGEVRRRAKVNPIALNEKVFVKEK